MSDSNSLSTVSDLLGGLRIGDEGDQDKEDKKVGQGSRLTEKDKTACRNHLTQLSTSAKLTVKVDLKLECEALVFQGKTEAELKEWIGYQPEKVNKSSGHTSARVLSKSCAQPQDVGTMLSQLQQTNMDKLQKEFKAIPKHLVTQTTALDLAKKYGFLSAKWIFFVKEALLPEMWQRLSRDAVNGKLPDGVHAVVLAAQMEKGNALTRNGQNRVNNDRKLSFKITDFSDDETNSKLIEYLEETQVKTRAMLKPDVFTNLGIYTDSGFGFSPTIEQHYINMAPPARFSRRY